MRRIHTLLIGLLLTTSIPTIAQSVQEDSLISKKELLLRKKWEHKLRFLENFSFEFNSGFGTRQHHITPITAGFSLNYDVIPRLYATLRFERLWALYKDNNLRYFYKNRNIAGGLGVRLIKGVPEDRDKKLNPTLELRMLVGGGVRNPDWKQTFYDANLVCYFPNNHIFFVPTFSAGYRFTDSRTIGLPNTHTFYVSIGLRGN